MSSALPPPPNDGPASPPGQPYGQPAYGQPAYGQPAYRQPAYGQQPPPPAPYGAMPTMTPYGQQLPPTKTSGMAISGFVLALVGLLPCFWFWFQIPGVLGLIFSILGLKATKNSAKKGRGLAIAGVVVSSIAILLAALITLFVYSTDDCETDGLVVECNFDTD